jgi:hypothetical protein
MLSRQRNKEKKQKTESVIFHPSAERATLPIVSIVINFGEVGVLQHICPDLLLSIEGYQTYRRSISASFHGLNKDALASVYASTMLVVAVIDG